MTPPTPPRGTGIPPASTCFNIFSWHRRLACVYMTLVAPLSRAVSEFNNSHHPTW